jgi:hypothetical protein
VKTILIAAAPAAMDVIAVALRNIARLVEARTFDEAMAVIRSGVGLIIIGTFFDGSRMFDLLREVKSDDALRGIPILCVRGISAPMGDAAAMQRPLISTFAVTDNAVRALGASGYVDLCGRRLAIGEDAATAEFVALARRCLDGSAA